MHFLNSDFTLGGYLQNGLNLKFEEDELPPFEEVELEMLPIEEVGLDVLPIEGDLEDCVVPSAKKVCNISKVDFPRIAELRDGARKSFSEIALLLTVERGFSVTQKQVRNIYDANVKKEEKQKRYLKWDEYKIRLLVDLRNGGKTDTEIARFFNEKFGVDRSGEAIFKKYASICKDLGVDLSGPVILPDDISFLVKDRKALNFSVEPIKEIFSSAGVEKSEEEISSRVSSICKGRVNIDLDDIRLSLVEPKSERMIWNRKRIELLGDLKRSGKTFPQIAKVFSAIYGFNHESGCYKNKYYACFGSKRTYDEITEEVSKEDGGALKKN